MVLVQLVFGQLHCRNPVAVEGCHNGPRACGTGEHVQSACELQDGNPLARAVHTERKIHLHGIHHACAVPGIP